MLHSDTPSSDFLKGTNLYLIGMMGAGKSTTGHALAEMLGYRFLDTDTLIEQAAGQTIPEIFEQQGEAAFRELETQVLSQLSAYTRMVIATGGGIVTRQINWSYLRHGIILWLDVPLNLLQQRLQGDTQRPLLQVTDWPQKLQTLLAQRESLYAQADLRVSVEAEEAAEAIAARAITLLQERIDHDQAERPHPPDHAPADLS